MTLSIDISESDTLLIQRYAAEKKMSMSDLFMQAVMEKIEDECDFRDYEKALAAYEADPVTYTHEEMGNRLGLAR